MGITIAIIVVLCTSAYLYELNGNSLNPSNTETFIVVSSSMDGEPRTQYDIETIPTGSMVFVKTISNGASPTDDFFSSLLVGDVLTFRWSSPVTGETMIVTHRIVSVEKQEGQYVYTLKGDAIADDPTNSSEQIIYSGSGDIIGKVVGVSPFFGSTAIFISSSLGKAILVTIAIAIIVVWAVYPIFFKRVSDD